MSTSRGTTRANSCRSRYMYDSLKRLPAGAVEEPKDVGGSLRQRPTERAELD